MCMLGNFPVRSFTRDSHAKMASSIREKGSFHFQKLHFCTFPGQTEVDPDLIL